MLNVPVSAVVRMSDGSRHSVPGHRVIDLYHAVEDPVPPFGDDDDAMGIKPLSRNGGKDEFARDRQWQIIKWLGEHRVPGAPAVMIIGDSIKMRISDGTGYGHHAYQRLVGKCNLIHIPHNCGGTKSVLPNLDNWLSAAPDIVFINCGLHDLATFSGGGLPTGYSNPDQYADNLRKIFSQIKSAGVKEVIWAPNTPVDDEWHATVRRAGKRLVIRKNRDVVIYNARASEIASSFDLPIADLYTPLIDSGLRKVLLSDGVHLNHQGSALCGKLVAEAVEIALEQFKDRSNQLG